MISHKLSEVAYVADKVTVMRDGAVIETIDNLDHNVDEVRIIKGMVGRELTNRFPKREHNISPEIGLEVEDWCVNHPVYTEKRVVNNVSFNVHKGEIVGFSALQGAGRTEVARSIFGRSYGAVITGKLKVNGKEARLRNEREAIEAGVAYLTEDRKGNGLILIDTVARNCTLARLKRFAARHYRRQQGK